MESKVKDQKFQKRETKPREVAERKIFRIGDDDLPGYKKIRNVFRDIYGVSFSYSNAIIKAINIDPNKKLQDLDENSMGRLKDALYNPSAYGIPKWMYNWRKEEETGVDKHYIGNDLMAKNNLNIQNIKLSGSYRGYRHQFGYKLRGQRTRSRGANFKGRVGPTVGVTKKKEQVQQQQQQQKKE